MAKQLNTSSARHGAEEPPRQGAAGVADGSSDSSYITYKQFLEWADEDSRAEWVDGTIEVSSPANLRHQEIGKFLLTTLSSFVDVHALGRVVGAPFQMRLARSGREPDVMYIANARVARLTPTYLDGPADLVVEVISPESIHRDRETKFSEYEEAGAPEYWLIDPGREQAEFYRLNARGRYDRAAIGPDDVYRSQAVPGFWLRVDWLWEQPLPDPVQVLLAVDRDAYGHYLREQLRQAGL